MKHFFDFPTNIKLEKKIKSSDKRIQVIKKNQIIKLNKKNH